MSGRGGLLRGSGLNTSGLLLTAWLPLCVACGTAGDSGGESGGEEDGGSVSGGAVGDAAELDTLPPTADTEDPAVEPALDSAPDTALETVAGSALDTVPGSGLDTVPGSADADSLAGDAPEASDSIAAAAPDVLIPAGTRISVLSDEDISTADYMVDDPVVATVWEDVMGVDGAVLVPAGTRMLGRVLASVGSGGAGEDPVLEIAFETLSSWTWERPVEGTVAEALVVLDPAGDFERRRAEGRRAAVTMVPGKIMAGSLIVVELRAPVLVPPASVLPDSVMQGDTLPLPS